MQILVFHQVIMWKYWGSLHASFLSNHWYGSCTPLLVQLLFTLCISLLSSSALSGLRKGSISWSPFTATKENTMKKNTQNLILYTRKVHPTKRHPGRTQLVTHQVIWMIQLIMALLYGMHIGLVLTNGHTQTHTNLCTCPCKHKDTATHTQGWFRSHY